jgi:hypothetical protein
MVLDSTQRSGRTEQIRRVKNTGEQKFQIEICFQMRLG